MPSFKIVLGMSLQSLAAGSQGSTMPSYIGHCYICSSSAHVFNTLSLNDSSDPSCPLSLWLKPEGAMKDVLIDFEVLPMSALQPSSIHSQSSVMNTQRLSCAIK